MDASRNLPIPHPAGTPQNSLADPDITLTDLTFPSLNQVLTQLAKQADGPKAGPWERWSFYVAIAGAIIGMLFGSILNDAPGLIAAILGLVLEIGGLGISLTLQLRRDWRQFQHTRAQHAEEMETGFRHYQGLIQQVRAFPLRERRRRQHFMRDRHSTMHERLGLFTGSFEKLGVMPVLLALYLQFKDWHWGDWSVLADVTLIQAMLVCLLLVAYAVSWQLIALRMRVQAYERLLEEANRQDVEEATASGAA